MLLAVATSDPMTLTDDLIKLGVRSGDVLMVHASLRAVGTSGTRAMH